MRPDQSRRRRSLYLSPVTVLRYRAHYKVVLFQTLNIGYPDTRLWPIFSTIYSGPIDGCGPPSLSPPRDSPVRAPCLHPTLPARASLSLLLLPPLRPFFV